MKKDGERYDKVFEQMVLLGIKDVSTPRQCKNGTIVWRLPIKINYPGNAERFIEVASFSTGYVRNQNCGYSNYQLNKRCESEPQYYPVHEWCDKADDYIKTDKFRQYTTRSCVLIPNEIDRLEYLIGYCLKNYYIKNANQVANGGYVDKWYHDYELERANSTYGQNTGAMARIDDLESEVRELETKYQSSQAKLEQVNKPFEVNGLQNKLANSVPTWKYKELEDRIYELESQVNIYSDKNVDLSAQLHMVQEELSATKVRQDVSVIVNGHRYKVL
jgi:hypothetical protein